MNETFLNEETYGTGKKKLSIYSVGMILCIILTLIPFFAIMYGTFTANIKFTFIFLSAILQFLVQVIFFLRLNAKNEPSKMNLMSFVFTIIILFFIVAGTVWIMQSLHYNMMM